ncbi:MAG: response regulator transcription factor [Candidatus Rokubacteria bacterium]|nr:response regulator transcription factor [Candidatus Rokubacteria bacterium]
MHPIRVLLVDDNATFRETAVRFLAEASGGQVAVAGTASRGDEALLEAERLRPDVVLLDLRMPGPSGLETIPRLRHLLPDSRIVVLTMFDTEAYRHAALTRGANDFISKATMTSELLPAIRRAAGAASSWRTLPDAQRAPDVRGHPDDGRAH